MVCLLVYSTLKINDAIREGGYIAFGSTLY